MHIAPQQVAHILVGARPKIQGWISNAETDDPESLGNFRVIVITTEILIQVLQTLSYKSMIRSTPS